MIRALVHTRPLRTQAAVAAPTAVNAPSPAPPNPSLCYADFRAFLTDLNASSDYTDWCSAQPGDCAKWVTYSNAILTGGTPSRPTMATIFGDALVDAGVIALDGIIPCRAAHRLKAAFSWSIFADGLTVQFQNDSTPGADGYDTWAWNYGDGTGVVGPGSNTWSPSHIYALTGAYLVTLTITGNDGSTSAVTHLVNLVESSGTGFHIDGVTL